MSKAVEVRDGGLDALCRFTLGNFQVEVVASRGKPLADASRPSIASFEHGGVHFLLRQVEALAGAADPLHGILTTREREIVRLVAAGLRNKQIAYELHLSEYTVAAYLKHISYKLQVRNRTAMVTRWNQLGAAPVRELAENACRGNPG